MTSVRHDPFPFSRLLFLYSYNNKYAKKAADNGSDEVKPVQFSSIQQEHNNRRDDADDNSQKNDPFGAHMLPPLSASILYIHFTVINTCLLEKAIRDLSF
jgi:hypothetical protein